MIKAIVDKHTIAQFAKFRDNTHLNHGSRRPLSEGFEEVGLFGEAEFARAYNLPLDLRAITTGDKGVDFDTIAGTVDVKTARKAFYLIVEEGKVIADIYVLASFNNESKTAHLIGWEYGGEMKKCPVKDFGYGIRNHYKSASKLRKMSELWLLLKGGSNG